MQKFKHLLQCVVGRDEDDDLASQFIALEGQALNSLAIITAYRKPKNHPSLRMGLRIGLAFSAGIVSQRMSGKTVAQIMLMTQKLNAISQP